MNILYIYVSHRLFLLSQHQTIDFRFESELAVVLETDAFSRCDAFRRRIGRKRMPFRSPPVEFAATKNLLQRVGASLFGRRHRRLFDDDVSARRRRRVCVFVRRRFRAMHWARWGRFGDDARRAHAQRIDARRVEFKVERCCHDLGESASGTTAFYIGRVFM